jgi:hypothetical protein
MDAHLLFQSSVGLAEDFFVRFRRLVMASKIWDFWLLPVVKKFFPCDIEIVHNSDWFKL